MRILLALLLFPASIFAEEKSAYCTNIGDGEFEHIHDVCMAGDVIEVVGAQVMTYCDFSKQIILSPIKNERYACVYVGHNRKFRSLVDGKLSEWVVKD